MNRYALMRYERGLTQGEVADGAGVSVRTLRQLEQTDGMQPSAPTAKALADFYGLSIREFLGLNGQAA
jgi:transcriptional regulator with XRE-family HTH domain